MLFVNVVRVKALTIILLGTFKSKDLSEQYVSALIFLGISPTYNRIYKRHGVLFIQRESYNRCIVRAVHNSRARSTANCFYWGIYLTVIH